MTTETLSFETLTKKLDAAGVEYTHTDRGTDREAIDIPGYGKVCYDSRPFRGGWFTRGPRGLGYGADSPIEEDRLLADLTLLADMAARIK